MGEIVMKKIVCLFVQICHTNCEITNGKQMCHVNVPCVKQFYLCVGGETAAAT